MLSMYSILEGSSASPEVTNVSLLLSKDSKSCEDSLGQGIVSAAPR
jgi:hypothetical protein